jgi:hypothetical protein
LRGQALDVPWNFDEKGKANEKQIYCALRGNSVKNNKGMVVGNSLSGFRIGGPFAEREKRRRRYLGILLADGDGQMVAFERSAH